MNEHKRDEREMHADLEVHTPSWLPGAKLSLGYKRLWDKRAEQFVENTARSMSIDPVALLERISEDNRGSDIFLRACLRATEVGDEYYRNTLARIVSAALLDDARILTLSFLIDRLVKLDPIHVRIIALFPFRTPDEARDGGLNVPFVEKEIPGVTSILVEKNGNLHPKNFPQYVRAESAVVESCIAELVSIGFIKEVSEGQVWLVTELGKKAGSIIADIASELTDAAVG